MRSLALAFLLLTPAIVHAAVFPPPVLPVGVAVVPGSLCETNNDCVFGNMQCWPAVGNTRGERRCACAYGDTWDAFNNRCASPAALGRSVEVVVRTTSITNTTIGTPLVVYEEQWASPDSTIPYPDVWYCDAVARYCWATQDGTQVVSTIARDYYHIRSRVLGSTRVPLAHMIWQCSEGVLNYLNDNTAPVSALGTGMRPISQHCTPCGANSTWCGAHGSCLANYDCTCEDGWTGDRCEVPPPENVVNATAPIGMYSDTFPCNPLYQTSCGPNELCYFTNFSPTPTADDGVCACAPGFHRDPLSNTYVYASLGFGAPQLIAVQQLCVNSSQTGVFVGAPVPSVNAQTGVAVADVVFLTDQPWSIWWADSQGQLVAARTPVFANATDPTWYPQQLTWNVTTCVDMSLYFYQPNGSVCLGAAGVCGLGVNATQSDPVSGACVCASNFVMNPATGLCDLCATGWTGYLCNEAPSRCAATECAGNGTCVPGPYWSAKYTASPERLAGPNLDPLDFGIGFTSVPASCVCGDPAGLLLGGNASICTNTSACVDLVRVGDNELVLCPPTGVCSLAPLSASPDVCMCASGYGGANCTTTAEQCALEKCSVTPAGVITGTCVTTAAVSECACTKTTTGALEWYGPTCNQTAAQCRAQRCSGTGDCLLQNQGCACDTYWGGADCSELQCANAQPTVANGSACVCEPSFYGEYCEYWTCNQDSVLTPSGCVCRGAWRLDANGNCTANVCGDGVPLAGAPWLCVCDVGASFYDSAPFCRNTCIHGQSVGPACVCDLGWGGVACDVWFGAFSAQVSTANAVAVLLLVVVGVFAPLLASTASRAV